MMTTIRTKRKKKARATINHSRRLLRNTIAILALLCGCGWALAAAPQSAKKDHNPGPDYALIYGTVWSAANQPAYGVPVKVRRAGEKKARWTATSDHHGEFAVRVPPGEQDYVVWADIKTGKGQEKPQRSVHVINDERVDTSLHLPEEQAPGGRR